MQEVQPGLRSRKLNFRLPTFLKFPTPWQEGNEVWMLKSMEIVVHSKKSVSTKVSNDIVPFQQEFPT